MRLRKGGGPCSLLPSTLHPILPDPFHFQHPLLFTNFHRSFFIFLCSLLLLNVSSCSLIISLTPCWIFQFFAAPCSLFQILCSLLPDYVFLAPCSLPYFRLCSLLPWVSRAILPAPWVVTGFVNVGYVSFFKIPCIAIVAAASQYISASHYEYLHHIWYHSNGGLTTSTNQNNRTYSPWRIGGNKFQVKLQTLNYTQFKSYDYRILYCRCTGGHNYMCMKRSFGVPSPGKKLVS